MKNFINNNIVNTLILIVLALIAFQLFTLNTNVTDISKRVEIIESIQAEQIKNLPTSIDVGNVEDVLDDILRCSVNYKGFVKPLNCR